ncbi:hypothetical protein [Ottowia testudinis]|uniref:Uncharacterized protein n=1 Tax=Ottowia testudinis TaxID=2816950 RepID=A0A975CFT1_9BURK|nr:hypothetical protein [Ottowia testudinis]QTD44976.1 hypothetical protein J1M35_18315 [Ottowia testudinis]
MAASNSIREQTLQAVVTRLQQLATDAVLRELPAFTVHRNPTVALTREQSPALVVFVEGDAITQRANDRVTRELTVRITALARTQLAPDGSTLVVAETQADQLLAAAHATMFADVNFGGLALGLRELETEWDIEDADPVVCAIPARYAISYRTLMGDLTVQG